MRSSWESLRSALMKWSESREARRAFHTLRMQAAVLQEYGSPAALAEVLARASDLHKKDRVLEALICSLDDAGTCRLAQVLLLLCLWPGLDAIYRRRISFFRHEPQDLAAEIVDRFTDCVRRVDLRRVTCLTATLVRNTERDVVDARRKEAALAASAVEMRLDEPEPRDSAFRAAPFGVPCARWDASSVAGLREWLRHAVGDDADLVIDAVLLEKSGRELAESFGMSHAAARQRLGRALTRARRAFLADGQSQSASATRFC